MMLRRPALVAGSALVLLGPVRAAAQAPATPTAAQAARRPDLRFTGLLLMNGFHNGGRTNSNDVPAFALPPVLAPAPPPEANLGGAVRQTRLGLLATLEGFQGGALDAELDVDFFGGQQPSTGGRTFPLLRVRRAFVRQQWRHVHVLAGQEGLPIAGVTPSSLAAIGVPLFASAGNLWLWLPQLRITALTREPGRLRVGAEVAALAPTSGDAVEPFSTQPERAERTGRPYLQGRLLARWGAGGRQGEVSVGAHLGWLISPQGTRETADAIAVSARVPLATVVELRGEAFAGRGLAGLGGGAIGQNFDPFASAPRTLPSRAGWAQLLAFPLRDVEFGVGGGIDDPVLPTGFLTLPGAPTLIASQTRDRNVAYGGHVHWRPEPLVVGLEVRQIETRFLTGPQREALHVNLAVGVAF